MHDADSYHLLYLPPFFALFIYFPGIFNFDILKLRLWRNKFAQLTQAGTGRAHLYTRARQKARAVDQPGQW